MSRHLDIPLGTETKPPRLIAFGGAFDPPHNGHVEALRLALAHAENAIAVVLPAAHPAGASGAHKQPVASFEERIALCEAAFRPLGDSVTVSSLERELSAPNYTAQTLERLEGWRSGRRLTWLMGRDQWNAFDRWHDPLAILRLADLYVVGRPLEAAERPFDFAESARTLAERLGTRALATKMTPFEEGIRSVLFPDLMSAAFYPGDVTCPAASSHLRSELAAGRSAPRGWLPPLVAELIGTKGLYRAPTACGV